MKRILAILMAISLAVPAFGTPVANADMVTGPWTWTDLSGFLTERNNRPVWTVGYANGSWFYSDGQDLWNGGQVYRYDSSTQVNITSDVRNAGVSRVDDIVTDGQTVLFLQNIVRMDNQLNVVAYRTNGQYTNLTNAVRNILQSDEGVSSITGRNGSWMVITTKARLFQWNGTNLPYQVTLPSGLVNVVDYSPSALVYNVNHGSPSNGYDRLPLAIVPISNNQWLLMGDPVNGQVRFFRYDGSTFYDVTNAVLTNADYISKIASNGTQAIISGYANGTRNRLTDGYTSYDISGKGTLRDTLIGWNGKSWMLVQGKQLSRMSGSFGNLYTEDYGRTADKLLSIAGDNNGRFLIGAAVSNTGTDEPTFPLTAKLLMVSEGVTPPSTNNGSGNSGTYGGDRVYTSSSGPRVTVQGDPSDFRVGNGKEFAYRVTASDADGVDRTDIYVNDARVKTCYSDVCEYRTTYWVSGASTRSVKFSVRSTDKRGYSTDSSNNPDYLTVDQNSSAGANGSSSNNGTNTPSGDGTSSTWIWLDPNTTTLRDQSVIFNVGAWDQDGIKRIEILVNGSTRRTCDLGNATGNQTCSYGVIPQDYPLGTNVFVNAKITDANDNVMWSNSQTLYRSSTDGNTGGNNNNTNGNVWSWLDPNTNAFNDNQTITFTMQAQDPDGIDRMEIFVNGSVKRTCELNNPTNNQTCSLTLYAGDYAQDTHVSVNGRMTDRYGNNAWTDLETLYRGTDNGNGGSNTNTNGSITSWLDATTKITLEDNQSILYHVSAQDPDGLSRVEIYANGTVIRNCTLGNSTAKQECTVSIVANDYSRGTSVYVNAKSTDRYGNVSWSNDTTFTRPEAGSGNGGGSESGLVSAWSWFEPSGDVARNTDVQFRAGGWAERGLAKMQVYVNGSVRGTCAFGNAYGNQLCGATFPASNYPAGTTLSANVKATDADGRVVWSELKSITVIDDGGTTPTPGDDNAPAVWEWLEPSTDKLTTEQTVFYGVGAWDADGVRSITIWVNGTARPACDFSTGYGNQACSVTLQGSDYPAGTSVFVNAVAKDASGRETWTSGKTIAVNAGSGSTNNNVNTATNNTNQNGSLHLSTDHLSGTYGPRERITIAAFASDPDGIDHIDLYVNAEKVKTCTGRTRCAVTVGPFPSQPVVTYSATLVDKLGNEMTTPYAQLNQK